MRRVVAVMVAGALVPIGAAAAGAETSPARARGGRVVTAAYEPGRQGQIVVDAGTITGSQAVSVATVEVFPRRDERSVVVTAVDDWGSAVRIDVHQGRDFMGMFCAGSDDPVAIRPGEPVTIEVFSGACGGATGVATSGIVEVTFFRRAAPS